jgi:hypothetical protein
MKAVDVVEDESDADDEDGESERGHRHLYDISMALKGQKG